MHQKSLQGISSHCLLLCGCFQQYGGGSLIKLVFWGAKSVLVTVIWWIPFLGNPNLFWRPYFGRFRFSGIQICFGDRNLADSRFSGTQICFGDRILGDSGFRASKSVLAIVIWRIPFFGNPNLFW
jgi:hypothetical protein